MSIEIPTLNGDTWLAAERQVQPHNWKAREKNGAIAQQPTGVLRLPAARLEFDHSLVLGHRESLVGASEFLWAQYFLYPSNSFKDPEAKKDEPGWLVRSTPGLQGNYVSHFDKTIKNVELRCQKRVNGLFDGHAQMGQWDRIRVVDPAEWGIRIGRGSRVGHHGEMEVQGTSTNAERHGSGFYVDSAQGVDLGVLHCHRLNHGVTMWRAFGCRALIVTEHTTEPLKLVECGNLEIQMECRTSDDILFDLTGCREGVHVHGRVNHSSWQMHYIDRNGRTQQLGLGGHGEAGLIFNVRT